jgi:DNA adenine methylase
MAMQQLPFPTVPQQLAPSRVGAVPCLRWAGAKRWIVPVIADGVWKHLALTGGRYFEPFLGGGALALDLGLPRMILNDICQPLMTMYREVTVHPERVVERMEWLVQAVAKGGIDANSYYLIRDAEPVTALDVAARFLILNATCFNGVYRVNKSGKFNVPYGDRTEKHLASLEKLRMVAVAFATSDLICHDFRAIIAGAGKGDLLFVDSPYAETFTGYDKGGFTSTDQRDLAIWLQNASNRGATFVATNNDTPVIRRLYDFAEIFESSEQRKVNSDGAGRKPAPCLIITNDPNILNAKTDGP